MKLLITTSPNPPRLIKTKLSVWLKILAEIEIVFNYKMI